MMIPNILTHNNKKHQDLMISVKDHIVTGESSSEEEEVVEDSTEEPMVDQKVQKVLANLVVLELVDIGKMLLIIG
jgi:hypothetical protein